MNKSILIDSKVGEDQIIYNINTDNVEVISLFNDIGIIKENHILISRKISKNKFIVCIDGLEYCIRKDLLKHVEVIPCKCETRNDCKFLTNCIYRMTNKCQN